MNMKIQVFGSGCAKCKELYERTQKAVQSLGIDAAVEYITDVKKLLEMGVMSSPVLAINGSPVLVGVVPDVEKIKQIISGNTDKPKKNNECKCNCGGNC